MINPIYRAQVQLLLRILPYIAEEKDLALKGGTAINMFIWDMPRLSVDLDLTYIKFDQRNIALANISAAINRIKDRFTKALPGIRLETRGSSEDYEEKLICWYQGAQVKIEVNTIMRGIIRPTHILPITKAVQKEFNLFAEMNIVSNAEIFGGKICAALDRQHPRDLFDINYLLENSGINKEIKQGFIAALLSHPRSIHEMLRPNFHDQQEVFYNQFYGMTTTKFSYFDFEFTRRNLLETVHNMLNEQDKNFLLSFKSAIPKWDLTDIKGLSELPAIKWKLLNIQKLAQENPKRHADFVQKLKDCF
jgi:predicted nucleotidyltransferase component of viral defense system